MKKWMFLINLEWSFWMNKIKRNFFTLLGLYLFVFLVNYQIIHFNFMYVEQSEIYLANQQIHSWQDLLTIYLYPKMFNLFYIPFFRPSGHFLIYQLITPILGWHNHRSFIAINLFFLALTGLMIIKLYRLLFPDFKTGAYIAFGFYLMHPALILSRTIVLHFEFAHAFFVIFSIYCFAKFCQINFTNSNLYEIKIKRYQHLGFSLLAFIIAVTFKEPAIMTGPCLFVFLCLTLFSHHSIISFFKGIIQNKSLWQLMAILVFLSASITIYITLAWPTIQNSIKPHTTWTDTFIATKKLFSYFFAFPHSYVPQNKFLDTLMWQNVYPLLTQLIIWILIFSLVYTLFLCFKKHTEISRHERKSLFFVIASSLLFLILPIAWGIAGPWHLNLSLLFLGLAMGFSVDFLLHKATYHSLVASRITFFIGLLIGLTTILVNYVNLRAVVKHDGFSITLNRNALLNPPPIKNQFNNNSTLVIEDSNYMDAYILGNSYPINLLKTVGTYDFNYLNLLQQYSLFKFDSIEGGTLFRFSYLMPSLREEVVPFKITQMSLVPEIVIYHWLQRINNIFCLGYNESGNWFDHTADFKKNLLQEKLKRHLHVSFYHEIALTQFSGNVIYQIKLPFPENELCKLSCDKDKHCAGFTFIQEKNLRKCNFYGVSLKRNNISRCTACTSYLKLRMDSDESSRILPFQKT